MISKIDEKIAKKTLEAFEDMKWQDISINNIYKKMKIKKTTINDRYKKKENLLINIIKFFDKKLIESSSLINDSDSRDMLIEILMTRFDLLQSYRKSIINIHSLIKSRPNIFFILLPHFNNSSSVSLKSIKTNTRGITGKIKVKVFLLIYFASFYVWIEDNSPGLEKTMASIDRYINLAENLTKSLKF